MQKLSDTNFSFNSNHYLQHNLQTVIPFPNEPKCYLENLALSQGGQVAGVFKQDKSRSVHLWDVTAATHECAFIHSLDHSASLTFAGDTLLCTVEGNLGVVKEKRIKWNKMHEHPCSLHAQKEHAVTMALDSSGEKSKIFVWDLNRFKAINGFFTEWQGRNQAFLLGPTHQMVVTVQSGRSDRFNEIALWDTTLWRNKKVMKFDVESSNDIFSAALVSDGVALRLLTRSYNKFSTDIRNLSFLNFGQMVGTHQDPQGETWSFDGSQIVAAHGPNYCVENKTAVHSTKEQPCSTQNNLRLNSLNLKSDETKIFNLQRKPENYQLNETTGTHVVAAINDSQLATHGTQDGKKSLFVFNDLFKSTKIS